MAGWLAQRRGVDVLPPVVGPIQILKLDHVSKSYPISDHLQGSGHSHGTPRPLESRSFVSFSARQSRRYSPQHQTCPGCTPGMRNERLSSVVAVRAIDSLSAAPKQWLRG